MANDQSGRNPGTFNNVPINFNNPWDAVRGDDKADNFHVSNMGIRFMHYISMPDPLFKTKQGDIRQSQDHEDLQQFADSEKFHRENEFLYLRKSVVFGTFTSNSKDMKAVAAGLYGDSGAAITLNRYYENSEEKVKIAENDKLVPCELIEEFFTVNYQEFHHNPSGIDRMQFKVCGVAALIDNAGVMYQEGSDFAVENGYIKWIDGGNRPGLDPVTSEGRLCSIRYTYSPYYYIKLVLHDIRIRPALLPDGGVSAKSGPLQAMVQADWVYLDRRTANEKDTAAQLEEGTGENTGPR